MLHNIILIVVFIAASVVGYLIINKVPSLLHTPLLKKQGSPCVLEPITIFRLT